MKINIFLCLYLLISVIAFRVFVYGQININSLSSPYSKNFNALSDTGIYNSWTDNSTVAGVYATLITYRADDGNSVTGAMYSYGATSSTERAFGAVTSNTIPTVRLGLRLLNNTGSTIGLLQISYVGEQWRRNIFAHRLTFEYQVGATSLTSGTWTAVPAFDFVAPNSGTAAALDGNNAANRTSVSGNLIVTVAAGQEIWLRWTKTGTNSPGLAIDDFSVTAESAPAVTNYYSKSTGDLDALGTWGTNTDGSGTSPSDFTSNDQVFNIVNNTAPTINNSWTVSGTNSIVVLGDGSNAVNFTIPSSYSLTGKINLTSNGTLTLQNTTLPTFNQISAASTVVHNQSGTFVIPATPALYGNLTLSGGTKEFASGFYTIGGNLILDGVSNFCGSGVSPYTWIYLSKDYIVQNGTTYNTAKAGRHNLFFIGANAQILKGNGIDIKAYRLVVDNSAGVSLSETGGTSNLLLAAGYSLAKGNLSVGANTLTFDSSVAYISGSVNGTLTVSTSSNLIFNLLNGSAGYGTLLLTPSFNNLNNFTYNASGVNPKMTIGTDVTIGGTLTVTDGCLSIAGALTNNGTVIINDTIRLDDGATVSGSAFTYGANGTLVFNDTASRRIVGDDPYWPSSNGPKYVFIKNGGGIQMNVARTVSGKFTAGDGGVTNGNNLTFNDTLQIDVSGYITGIPTYGGNATLFYNIGSTYDVWNEWTGTGSVGVGVPKNVLINTNTSLSMRNGNHGIPGDLTISGGTLILNASSGDLYVGGNWINNGTFTANSRTVVFDATLGGKIISGAMTGGNKFYDLLFFGAGGEWALQNSLECGNNLTIAAGTLYADSQFVTLQGNWADSGTFTHSGCFVTFNGTSTQSITVPGGESFGRLIINNSAGVTLNNDVTIEEQLTLTNGKVYTGANALAIGAYSTVTRISGHVIGNLKKNVVTGATTLTFEIGDATNYTPVSVAFGNVSVAGDLTISTTTGSHPDIANSRINSSKSLNRYYTLTNSGTGYNNYTATFNFAPSDVVGGANTAYYVVKKYDTGIWVPVKTVNPLSTSIQGTALTGMGDFAIGEATTVYSNGTGGGDWSSTTTWQGGVVPDTVENAVIVTGDSVYVIAPAKCGGFTLNGKINTEAAFTVSNVLTLDAGSWYYYNSEPGGALPGTTRVIDNSSTVIFRTWKVGGVGNLEFGNVVIERSAGSTAFGNLIINGNLTINNLVNTATFKGIDKNIKGYQTHTVKGNVYIYKGVLSCIDAGSDSTNGCTWNIEGDVNLSCAVSADARIGPISSAREDGSGTRGLGVFNIGGNLVINGGRLQAGTSSTLATGKGIINLGGDLTITGGAHVTTNTVGPFAFNFVGTGTQTIKLDTNFTMRTNLYDTVASSANVIFDFGPYYWNSADSLNGVFVVNGTLSMNDSSRLIGTQSFKLNPGAKLKIGSVDGIASVGNDKGNIQVTGTKTFSGSANYEYNGPLAQNTGNELVPTMNNLTINNSAGVTLNANMSVTNNLTLSNGLFNVQSYTLTLNGASIGGTPSNLRTMSSSNIIFGGSSTGISMPNSVSMLNNLTVNNANGVTLNSNPTIYGTLSLTNGALNIGAHTITLNGTVTRTGGGMIGGSSSNIIYGGGGTATILPSVTLYNLAINRTSGVDLDGNVTINNNLTISSGTLRTGSYAITLGPNGVLSETSPAEVIGNISTLRNITATGSTENFGNIGLDIELHGTALGNTTIQRKTGTASAGNGHNSILRYFNITSDMNSYLNVDLIFHYYLSELNGQDPSTLKLYKSTDDGLSWSNHGGIVNTGARTISLIGVDDLARWTASNNANTLGNTPTPSIISINPVNTIVGQPEFILTVFGDNFIKDSSIVRINGHDRNSTFVNENQLTAVIPASDLTVVGNFNITVFNLGGGGESNSKEFAVLDAPNAVLQGIVYKDINSNGLKDDGEEGIPGWKISLSGSGVDSTITDATGFYSFVIRHNGTYTVAEELSDNYVQTEPLGTGYYTLTITTGQVYSGRNFGNAVGYEYVGPGTGNWSDTANWSGGQPPGPINPAIIPPGTVVLVDSLPSDSIQALRILNGGTLQISPEVAKLKIAQSVVIDPGAALQLPANSDSTGIICYQDWVNRGTFVPGQSTIVFKGDKPKKIVGEEDKNRFYKLEISGDSTATVGNIYINNSVRLDRSITLLEQDSIVIENDDTASIQSDGKILNGTVKRNIKPGETSKYRFESTESYLKFSADGINPKAVSVTTISNITPGNFYWDSAGGVPDPVKNTIIKDSVKHFSKWVFGTPRPKVTGMMTDSNYVKIDPLNRAYIINSEGGTDYNLELSLRYDQNEVPEGTDETKLRLFSGPYLTDTIPGRWNMVSLPLLTEEKNKMSIFPTAISDAFAFDSVYVNKSSLSFGEGYWLKFQSDQQIIIMGDDQYYCETPVKKGWNLIGAISYPIAASSVTSIPWGIIQSQFFGFTTRYEIADSLLPLKAYWIKTNSPGKLMLSAEGSANFYKSYAYNLDQFNSIKITDAGNNKQELFFGSNNAVDLEVYELPPLPPLGIFDVRYSSGRILEIAEKQVKDCLVHLSAAGYPIKIAWHMKEDSFKSSLLIDDKSLNLEHSGAIEIKNPQSQIKLRLYPNSPLNIPKEYSLDQNYPNPFNPSTTFKYQLPEESKVSLSIFNVLGQLVFKVVDCIEPAGTKSVEWKSTNIASGVYFYRLEAVSISDSRNTFSQVRKMIILK